MPEPLRAKFLGVHPIQFSRETLREIVLRMYEGLDKFPDELEEACNDWEDQARFTIEGLHLIEVLLEGDLSAVDVDKINQGESGPYSQAAYDEHWFSADGATVLAAHKSRSPTVEGPLRLAFFWHFLDVSKPLMGAWGALELPPSTPLTTRLRAFMPYYLPT